MPKLAKIAEARSSQALVERLPSSQHTYMHTHTHTQSKQLISSFNYSVFVFTHTHTCFIFTYSHHTLRATEHIINIIIIIIITGNEKTFKEAH